MVSEPRDAEPPSARVEGPSSTDSPACSPCKPGVFIGTRTVVQSTGASPCAYTEISSTLSTCRCWTSVARVLLFLRTYPATSVACPEPPP